jgi:hypothetical protein
MKIHEKDIDCPKQILSRLWTLLTDSGKNRNLLLVVMVQLETVKVF